MEEEDDDDDDELLFVFVEIFDVDDDEDNDGLIENFFCVAVAAVPGIKIGSAVLPVTCCLCLVIGKDNCDEK